MSCVVRIPSSKQKGAVILRATESPRETVQVIYPVKTVEKKLQTQSERREDIEESVQRKHSDTSRKQREDLNARKREYALILKTEKKSTPKYNEAAARKHAELGHEHVAEDLVLKMVESDKKAYPALTDEQRGVVERVLIGESPSEVIISKFNISITRNDLTTLLEDNWLNDQVINFYMNLLMERSELRANEGLPRVYAMNTFFMPKLLSAGHSDLKQWTQKVDIFTYDIIPVPVHVDANHWCMAIIDLRNRAIRYYDSKGTPNYAVLNLNALEQYLRDESLDKRNQPFDTSGFRKEIMREYALQTNDSDCGVFCCMFAEHETRNQPIGFGQMHMAYFRQKMIYEIAQGRLLT